MKQETFRIQQVFIDKGFTLNQIKEVVEVIVNTKTEEFNDFIDYEYFGEYRTKRETKTIIIESEKTRTNPDNIIIYRVDVSCTNENIEEVIKIANALWHYATDEFTTQKMIDIKEDFNVDVKQYEVNGVIDEDWNELFKMTMEIKSHYVIEEIRSFSTFNI
jgi:hypothetical protein